jgi:hypothetical protein
MLKGYKDFIKFSIILPTFALVCQGFFKKMSFICISVGAVWA